MKKLISILTLSLLVACGEENSSNTPLTADVTDAVGFVEINNRLYRVDESVNFTDLTETALSPIFNDEDGGVSINKVIKTKDYWVFQGIINKGTISYDDNGNPIYTNTCNLMVINKDNNEIICLKINGRQSNGLIDAVYDKNSDDTVVFFNSCKLYKTHSGETCYSDTDFAINKWSAKENLIYTLTSLELSILARTGFSINNYFMSNVQVKGQGQSHYSSLLYDGQNWSNTDENPNLLNKNFNFYQTLRISDTEVLITGETAVNSNILESFLMTLNDDMELIATPIETTFDDNEKYCSGNGLKLINANGRIFATAVNACLFDLNTMTANYLGGRAEYYNPVNKYFYNREITNGNQANFKIGIIDTNKDDPYYEEIYDFNSSPERTRFIIINSIETFSAYNKLLVKGMGRQGEAITLTFDVFNLTFEDEIVSVVPPPISAIYW